MDNLQSTGEQLVKLLPKLNKGAVFAYDKENLHRYADIIEARNIFYLI